MIGKWNIKGSESGPDGWIEKWTSYLRVLEVDFSLVQHIAIDYIGQTIRGIEYVGHDKSSKTLKSHYFDNIESAFECVWEVSDETLRNEWICGFSGEFQG